MRIHWLVLLAATSHPAFAQPMTPAPPAASPSVIAELTDEAGRSKNLALSRGRVFMELKSFEPAAEQFSIALSFDPDDLDIRMLYALALYADGRPEEALPSLATVAEARPESALCAEFLGRSLFQLGMFPQAEEALAQSVLLNPTDARLRNQLGVVRLRLDRGLEALQDFVAATQLDPFHDLAHYNAGLLSAATGDTEAASEHLEAAVAIAIDDPDPAESLGDLHRDHGDYAEAAKWYEVAAERAPERSDLWLLVGLACRESGDRLRALTAMEIACAQEEVHPVSFLVLARVQESLGRSEDGLETLTMGLRRTPEATDLHRELANFAEDLGEYRLATQHLEVVCGSDGGDPNDHRRLAELHEAMGDHDEALRWYRKLITTNEGGNDDLAAIAERMVASKIEGIRNVETGFALASSLVKRTRGKSLSALMVLAQAEVEVGRSGDAVETLRRAADLFEPDDLLFAMLTEKAAALGR